MDSSANATTDERRDHSYEVTIVGGGRVGTALERMAGRCKLDPRGLKSALVSSKVQPNEDKLAFKHGF